ncbi:hypothetical protein GCM10011482_15450 [Enterococcus alcedinis]|uniref:Uncharacterized protein n=1 Tax=Enterococcus alcedinis TaxID=1274384 RepID=A0A917JHS8_9ENTE|nr:hypothetical protein GCM10011482_15450 [Enterococcus alcedinis]
MCSNPIDLISVKSEMRPNSLIFYNKKIYNTEVFMTTPNGLEWIFNTETEKYEKMRPDYVSELNLL